MARTKQIPKPTDPKYADYKKHQAAKTLGSRKQASAAAPHTKMLSSVLPAAGGGPAGGVQKKKKGHRFRSGTVAIFEIRRYQKSTALLVPRAPVIRLTRELAYEFAQKDVRFKKDALLSIHQASEEFLTEMFTRAIRLCVYAKRQTITVGDLQYVLVDMYANASAEAQKVVTMLPAETPAAAPKAKPKPKAAVARKPKAAAVAKVPATPKMKSKADAAAAAERAQIIARAMASDNDEEEEEEEETGDEEEDEVDL